MDDLAVGVAPLAEIAEPGIASHLRRLRLLHLPTAFRRASWSIMGTR
jgi:hypothetical protein